MNNYLKRVKNMQKKLSKVFRYGYKFRRKYGCVGVFSITSPHTASLLRSSAPPGITIAVHASLLNVKFLDFSLFYE